MSRTGREIHLAERPVGAPTTDTFTLVETSVPEPGEGEILVRNHWMSVDPAMRGRMDDRPSYVEPFQVGSPLEGGAVGEVVASNSDRHAVGDLVLHGLGWRDLALLPGKKAAPVDASLASEQAFLGILGMPGLTAYSGLVRLGRVAEGDVVFVSAAAGAVGSAVGQMARKLGASRVIGSAGGPEKVRHVVEDLGFDACIDYKSGSVRKQLKAAAPDGVDVYFDNVGGEHLEVAIGALNLHGRIVVCGMISQYNATEPPAGPRNLVRLIQTRGSIQGLLVLDHYDLRDEFVQRASGWLRDGDLKYEETVVDGLENAPTAMIDLLAGGNTGKMLVRIDG
ncbi:NADP-dependent oxidoreductase [Patulibacter sp.]|uniref:NADP-dependent oxidoreductase n=1 Tax=Patulibacter sp. TaxID=1912859 RepID=UPI00272203B6|nr:NADP-dependent oxidoreductase [Patulibacter sp.]MDO9407543.1 NADP-dependent oxidoreductase [Patulibacter sp.]